ncbi:hypothetical protein [Haloarchaeobius baliensis]|uniref:hypothetical protein n=1 Tax=Haloarchaeobius baliensis TaxID=1670458 RepID=UPI003F880F58
MHGTNFKVESELCAPGQVMNLPDAASTLSVEPVGPGLVRITYLKPVHEISIERPDETERAMAYVD